MWLQLKPSLIGYGTGDCRQGPCSQIPDPKLQWLERLALVPDIFPRELSDRAGQWLVAAGFPECIQRAIGFGPHGVICRALDAAEGTFGETLRAGVGLALVEEFVTDALASVIGQKDGFSTVEDL
jgi:hypothetical protein